jgi:hypothetical protein
MIEVWPARNSFAASPSIVRAAPAKKRNRSTLVDISSIAAPTGFPAFALVGSGLELVGELEQEQRAVLRGRLLPGFECLRGRLHGAIDVFGSARRHVGDDLVVRRVDDLGGATVRGVDERATDELLVGLDALERFGHGTASWA